MTTIAAVRKNGIAAIAADTFTQTRKSLENCLPLVYHAYLHHATATDIARTGVEAVIALNKNSASPITLYNVALQS